MKYDKQLKVMLPKICNKAAVRIAQGEGIVLRKVAMEFYSFGRVRKQSTPLSTPWQSK